jgi:glycosyltransferase involved in cell wall biosynthesis
MLTMKREEENEKRVSFILVTLNRADDLDKTLMNVREFLTADDELIVMDGGSIDHTHEIIKKHKDIVAVFESERDFGSAHAFNKGVLKSKGRVLVNLNDDDYFYPDGIKKAIKVMEENPSIDALLSGGEYYTQDSVNGELKLIKYQYLPESRVLKSDIKNIFYYAGAGFLLLNRRVIARVGLLDTTMQASDTEYMSRLIIAKANFKYLNIKMFRFTYRPNSSTRINCLEARRDAIIIAMRHGEWDEIMKYPLVEIGAALKLNDYLLGSWMLDLIQVKFLLSRYKKLSTFFLKSFLLGFHLVGIIIRHKKMHFIRKRIHRYFQKPELPVEPDWDGSLR